MRTANTSAQNVQNRQNAPLPQQGPQPRDNPQAKAGFDRAVTNVKNNEPNPVTQQLQRHARSASNPVENVGVHTLYNPAPDGQGALSPTKITFKGTSIQQGAEIKAIHGDVDIRTDDGTESDLDGSENGQVSVKLEPTNGNTLNFTVDSAQAPDFQGTIDLPSLPKDGSLIPVRVSLVDGSSIKIKEEQFTFVPSVQAKRVTNENGQVDVEVTANFSQNQVDVFKKITNNNLAQARFSGGRTQSSDEVDRKLVDGTASSEVNRALDAVNDVQEEKIQAAKDAYIRYATRTLEIAENPLQAVTASKDLGAKQNELEKLYNQVKRDATALGTEANNYEKAKQDAVATGVSEAELAEVISSNLPKSFKERPLEEIESRIYEATGKYFGVVADQLDKSMKAVDESSDLKAADDTMKIINQVIDGVVRRHGFLDRPQLELSEYLAHLFVDVKRPACGIASAVR